MSLAELMKSESSEQVAGEVFGSFNQFLIGLKGLDKKPWIYPLEAPCEINGTFWWLCDKSTMLYGSLSINPEAQIFAQDKDGTIFRLTGKACFSEDETVIAKCLEDKTGKKPEYQIAFFFKDGRITISQGEQSASWLLKTENEVFTGITVKKDKEIRDRLAKIIEERAAKSVTDVELQKLYDGLLLLTGESVKKLWPSFNMMALESCLLYETYDEREKYCNKAGALMGNITIKQVEDVSYYLNEETLGALLNK